MSKGPKKGAPTKGKVIEILTDLRYKKGYSNGMMIKYLQEEWNYEVARCYDFIREMKEEIGKTYLQVNKNVLEDTVEFMESQKAEAVKGGNGKLALEWQKEIDKVQQLHVQKLEIEAKKIEGISIIIKKEAE
jgi:hypothetical protein